MSDTSQEIVVTPAPGALAVQDYSPESLMAIALNKNISVEGIEKLCSLIRQAQADRARADFIRALSEFQAVCPIIQKKRAGYDNRYQFANLEDIKAIAGHLLLEHGLSYSWETQMNPERPGEVLVTCTISHLNGHQASSSMWLPTTSNNKGMSDPQKVSGAATYGKRLTLINALGLTMGDEDNDTEEMRPDFQHPVNHGKAPVPPAPAKAQPKQQGPTVTDDAMKALRAAAKDSKIAFTTTYRSVSEGIRNEIYRLHRDELVRLQEQANAAGTSATVPDRGKLLASLQGEAAKGTKVFNAAWSRLTEAEHKAVADQLSVLLSIAQKMDKPTSPAAPAPQTPDQTGWQNKVRWMWDQLNTPASTRKVMMGPYNVTDVGMLTERQARDLIDKVLQPAIDKRKPKAEPVGVGPPEDDGRGDAWEPAP